MKSRALLYLYLLIGAALFFDGSNSKAAVFDIADGDVAGLKAAMNTAATNQQSDVINLAANGTYTLTSVDNNSTNGLPIIGHDHLVFGTDLTINGNGALVQRSFADGTPSFRIFEIVGGNISLQNLRIYNGRGINNGGGVEYSGSGTVTLVNCTFSSNQAPNAGGSVANTGSGAVSLTNCLFAGNNQPISAGGGALSNFGGTVNITSCSFTSNQASTQGGAIYNAGTLNISSSTFQNSTAPNFWGGAISNVGGNVTITQTTIDSSNAKTDGGAIYSDGGQVTLIDSTLSNSGASRGGVLSILSGSLTITNCKVTAYGASNGGAIYNNGVVTADHTSFSGGNYLTGVEDATVDPTGSSLTGIAISNVGASASLTLTSCTISNNSASIFGAGSVYGIGIYNDGGAVNATDSAVDSGTGQFYHDFLTNSYGTIIFEGGAVFNKDGGQVNLNRCTLSTNLVPIGAIATTEGGAIFNNDSGNITILNCTIASNKANLGGGIRNDGNGAINLLYSTVSYNLAATAGGISNVSGPFSVKSSIIALNGVTNTDRDVSGSFTSNGFNLIGIDQNNGFNQPTDKRGGSGAPLDPQFASGSVADNGGPTRTIGLLSNSPAINSGDNNAPPLDQRGYLRVGTPDIGAYEFNALPIRFTSITRLANGHILLQGIGVPNSQHTVKMYPDLSANSDASASVTANGTGALQYDDAGAVGLTKRFYRLAFP